MKPWPKGNTLTAPAAKDGMGLFHRAGQLIADDTLGAKRSAVAD